MKKIILIGILFLIVVFITSTASAYLIRGLEKDVDAREFKTGGRQYVLLTDASKAHGIEWEWDSVSGKIVLRKNGDEITLLIGSKYYYRDKKIKKLNIPVCMEKGCVWVPLKFAKYTLGTIFKSPKKVSRAKKTKPVTRETSEKEEKKFKIKKVVIDPGHGGKDPGAVGKTKLYEKNVVLDISKSLKKELERKGIEVIMTRSSDKFVSLGGRTGIANKNNADLFISIHANANKRRWIRGFEIYHLSEATDDSSRALATAENSVLEYEEESFAKGAHTKDLDAIIWDLTLTENREESIELAGFVCQEVSRKLKLKKLGIKSARFYVLKGAKMPAVLVEVGYISNKWDEKNLKKSSYKEKLARGIAGGILAFKTDYERENGFSN